MEVRIRPAQRDDFEELIALFKEFATFEKHPEKMVNSVDLMIEEEAYFNCFVATVEGKIVGFASWFYAYFSWSGKSLYMDDLYVKNEYRKQGIGKKLLDAVIDFAKANSCKK